jgi:hypothetical protein
MCVPNGTGGRLAGNWEDWIAQGDWVSAGMELGRSGYTLATTGDLTKEQLLYLAAKIDQWHHYIGEIADVPPSFAEYLLARARKGHNDWGREIGMVSPHTTGKEST